MNFESICQLLSAELIYGESSSIENIEHAISSDLMSDVLVHYEQNTLLITGLSNIQTLRTAEMADIKAILFVRDKKVEPEMIKIAEENNIVLAKCSLSMFETSGILYNKGIKPIF